MANTSVKAFIGSLLSSYTLVFFSKNKFFGLILLVVSFFDLYTGIAGFLSVIITNAFALLIGLNYKKISSGYYGFNALLTGLGIGIAIQPSPSFYIILVFVSLSVLLLTLAFEGIIGKYALPYLSVPFLVALWLAISATRSYTGLTANESGIFTLNTMFIRGGKVFVDLYLWFDEIPWPVYVKTYFKSLGAIIFQYHLLSGILIAAGLLIYSRIAFVYSVVGFSAAWVFYLATGADIHELDYSFIGFNHILTAIAIGSFFTVASKWSMLWVLLITPLVSMLISASNQILSIYQLPVFSLPFNLVVLGFLYGMKFRERMLTKPELVVVQHFSPEKNLYASITASKRFRNQWFFPFSLPFYGFRHINQAHDGDMTHKDDWKHAWDFVITDDKGKEYANEGLILSDYYCYNKPVLAPADGWVTEVVDHIDDNEPGKTNLIQNWGNSIVIRHADHLYSKVSHLKKDSAAFQVGTYVKKGQVIAHTGNSGRSPYPHLHFQIQSNPYIGSVTLKYPISQYISLNGSHELKLYGTPELNEQVANVHPDSSLEKAFRFVPGQIIDYTTDGGKEGQWEVLTDSYNNIYLSCHETGAVAWLKVDGQLFYFTHFEGSRKSMLYYFFLSAYQVPMGYYKDLSLDDLFPPTILPYTPLNLLQDLIAPFYVFIRPVYKMNFGRKEEDITGNTIHINTQASYRFLNFWFMNSQSEIIVSDKGLDKLTIKKQGKETTLIFSKQTS